MPRPAMEAPTPIPALAPGVREPEGARVGDVSVEEEDEGEDEGEDEVEDEGEDAVVDVDSEDVEDGVILLLVDKAEEDGVAELDDACAVKDCGEGA